MEISVEFILAGFAAMGSAVAALWSIQRVNHKTTMEKLDMCEEKHEEAQNKMIEISEKVGRLSGVEELSNRVLDEIRKIRA